MTAGGHVQRLILRGGGSAAAGLVMRFGARLLYLLVAAQLFGAVLFGAFSLAVAAVELAVAVAGLGMKRYLFKLLDERDERHPGHVLLDTALLVTAASLILAVLIMLTAALLPPELIARNTALALLILAPMVAGQSLLDLFLAATRWRHLMRYEVGARSLVEPYFGLGATVAAYALGLRGEGLLIGYWTGTLAALLYAAAGARRATGGFNLRGYRPRSDRLASTLRESALPTATDGIAALFGRVDLYLVGILLGEGPSGVYAMARQLRTPIRQIRQSFDSLLTPILARTLAVRGPAQTGEAVASATRLILALQLPIVLALIVIGTPLLGWFGPGFGAGYKALLLLAVAETIQSAFSVGELILLYRRAHLALAVTAVAIMVYVVTAVPLIGLYGITGAAMSALLSLIASALLRRLLLRSSLSVRTPLLHSLGPIVAASVAVLAAFALARMMAGDPLTVHLAMLAVALTVYGAMLYLWLRATGDSLALLGFRTA